MKLSKFTINVSHTQNQRKRCLSRPNCQTNKPMKMTNQMFAHYHWWQMSETESVMSVCVCPAIAKTTAPSHRTESVLFIRRRNEQRFGYTAYGGMSSRPDEESKHRIVLISHTFFSCLFQFWQMPSWWLFRSKSHNTHNTFSEIVYAQTQHIREENQKHFLSHISHAILRVSLSESIVRRKRNEQNGFTWIDIEHNGQATRSGWKTERNSKK